MVQIYIEDTRIVGKFTELDVFDNESIQIEYKNKDMRDLSKVFATYSKDFSIPASPNNSKLLNYFFDETLVRSSNKFLRCKIYINGTIFKTGEITSTQARYKNNVISSYNISFSTGLPSIKDKIGEDMLKDLDFEDVNFVWNETNIANTIQSTTLKEVMVPLISRDKVWGLTGTTTENITSTGYVDIASLRPAIKLSTIYNKVVSKYNLNFNFPFTQTELFKSMYVWLNNESTSKTDETKLNIVKPFQIGTLVGHTSTISTISNGGVRVENVDNAKYIIQVSLLNPKNPFTNDVYKGDVTIKLVRNDGVEFTTTHTNNAQTTAFTINIIPPQYNAGDVYTYQIYLSSQHDISFTTFQVHVRPLSWLIHPDYQRSIDNPSPLIASSFNINKGLGDLKVIDFLSSLFKSVNAIFIEKQDNSTSDILTYPDIVRKTIDITRYTDTEEYSKEPTINYKTLTFSHQEAKYFRNKEYKNIVGKEYGSEVYVSDDNRLGGSYEVKTEFNILNYFMLDDSSLKTSYGFESEGNPNNGAKLTILVANKLEELYKYGEDLELFTIKIGNKATPLRISKYRMFGNQSINGDSITFDIDINPDGQVPMLKSLYSKYYSDFVSKNYHPNARILSIKSILPPTILNSMLITDRIVLADKEYSIDEASIDITTGITNFKLINKPANLSDIMPPPNIVQQFKVVGGNKSIKCTWLPDANIDKFYLEYKLTESTNMFHTTRILPNTGTTFTYTDLEPNTNYTARIRTLGFNGEFSEFVFDSDTTLPDSTHWVKPVQILNAIPYEFNSLTITFNGSDAELGVKGHWMYWKQLPDGIVQSRWVPQINNNQVSYSQEITGLQPNTQYEISVVTEDYQGNQSIPKIIVGQTLEGGKLLPPKSIVTDANIKNIKLLIALHPSTIGQFKTVKTDYLSIKGEWMTLRNNFNNQEIEQQQVLTPNQPFEAGHEYTLRTALFTGTEQLSPHTLTKFHIDMG